MTNDTRHADWTAIEADACREPSRPFTPEQEARVVELIAAAHRVKMTLSDPIATAGHLRPLSSNVIQSDVLPHEADSYPGAERLNSEIFGMSDSVRAPEFAMHDQHLRLECLKIAVASVDPEDGTRPATEHLVAQAELLSRFVIGTTNE